MTLSQDILAELAEIAPGSPLDQARAVRDASTRHAQGSYEVLFSQQDADFPLDERFAVAAKVAKLHQADALAAHYAGFGLADPTTDRLVPALAFARLLTFTPVEATPGALHTLTGAGWSLRGIVTLAQLVAFVSFQSRLLLACGRSTINRSSAPIRRRLPDTGIPHRIPRAAKRPRFASPAMSCTGNLGWPINRWRNSTLKNRRFWPNMAIATPPTFACWRAISRCWSSGP